MVDMTSLKSIADIFGHVGEQVDLGDNLHWL